jgi:uncharacterized protein YndB with AHSA1/START domain
LYPVLTLVLERTVPAPPSVVFGAFADPAQLARWWGPAGFTIPRADFAPRAGDSYRIEMQPPEGDRFALAGEFRAVEPGARLAFTFAWEPPDPDDVETLADLSFRDLGEATAITLTQGPFKTEERRALHRDGWSESLDKLERLLSGRADPWFEELYARSADDPERIPWARLAPRPELIKWLDRHPPAPGTPALVVASGLGDDAEELARRGCDVDAFDLSRSAIETARRRFPTSSVRYRVADLFALPADWAGRFAIVVESLTVQSLPPEAHEEAIAAITRLVAPGGHLLVRTAIRADDEPDAGRPWPLRQAELRWFEADGLIEVDRCTPVDGVFLHLDLRRRV